MSQSGDAGRRYFEHPAPDDPSRLDRWYCCPCCGYPTLGLPANYEICELCGWMDDGVNDSYYSASGSQTLAAARANFVRYRTKYPPGSMGFESQTANDRTAKERLVACYGRYMAEPDPCRRGVLWGEVRRLSDAL